MTHTELMRDWYRRVWEDEDLDAISEFFVPDMTARGLVDDVQVGPDEFKAFVMAALALVCDVKIIIEKSIEDGDWVSMLLTFKATDRNTEREISVTGQALCKIVDGKIVDAYNHLDVIRLYEKLGLLPEYTLEICLMGERIG
ncbi:MAG: ester cyclase [Halocynthiibacter sp.]